MAVNYINFFSSRLRLSRPWKYKIPLLIGFTYFFLLGGNLDSEVAWYSFAASICTTIGFAGFGYLTNDLSDRKADALAGKPNQISKLSNWSVVGLFLLFISMAIFPWFYLPVDEFSLILIGLEFLLFVLYAFPPFRLKEKGVIGLITDALYAHVTPAILASWTFYQVADRSYAQIEVFLIILGCWQFISGIRNILYHQIKDYDNDLLSNTKTFVTSIGIGRSQKALRIVIIPLEVIAFIAFGYFVQELLIFYLPLWLLFSIWKVSTLRKDVNSEIPSYQRFTNVVLDEFYVEWVPILLLIGVTIQPTVITPVLLCHIILFRSFPKTILKAANKWFYSSGLKAFIFDFQNFYKGLTLHIGILFFYSAIFCSAYFLLESRIDEPNAFFYYQHLLSKVLIGVILFHLATVIRFRKSQTITSIKEFIFEKGSAYNLALFRIVFLFVLLGSYQGEVFGTFETWTHLDESKKVGLPLIRWMVDWIPVSPEIYHAVAVTGFIVAFMAFIGLFTRWALLIHVPIALYLWGVPCIYGKLNHHHIMVWVPIILAFSRCYDVLSLDFVIKKYLLKKPVEVARNFIYALPFKFIWMLLAIIYMTSGFHKLWDTGLYWALSDNLSNQIQLEWVEHYDTVPNFRVDLYPVLVKIGGVMIILTEIIYPLFIIKRATRWIAFGWAWCLHLIAGYFLYIDFVHLRIVHLSYIDWDKIVTRLRGKKEVLTESVQHALKDLKPLKIVYIGLIFVVMNLAFSIAGINSWPFSAYPAYSSIVDDEVDIIRMDAFDSDNKKVDVKGIGQEQDFRWENIRPFEDRIAYKIRQGNTHNLDEDLEAYWTLWSSKVDGLEKVVRVEMTLERTPLAPEERHIILSSTYLGTVYPK